jgi:porin
MMGTAAAAADAPPIAVGLRETLDAWDNASGGLRGGAVLLNKLQISATVRGDSVGLPGLSAHAQIFRTDGPSLSARVGDVQTVSNIEAPPVTRLFEAWVQQRIGGDDRAAEIRAGLMDLNAQFDSNDSASLFVNSSHGIGPDISRSGRNGPSIFPVTGAGASLSLLLGKSWTLRVAAFDGAPGDPDRPKAFAAIRLGHGDGALLIAQADYHPSDEATIEGGVWRYTARLPAIGAPGMSARDQGGYASVAAPLPGLPGLKGWIRVGLANQEAQPVRAYLGAGLVAQSPFRARADDRLGLAVAHAVSSAPMRAAYGVPRAETTVEATYQLSVRRKLALQPDVQYVRHPAARARTADALVVGTRLVLTFGYPGQPSAIDAADPTVPPE